MIFKRFAADLRAQNWFAITVELAIVVVGVFIGTVVANWNERRAQEERARAMLEELRPGLVAFSDFFETARDYYDITRRYADTAFAGWRGEPGVGDDQFVISAYQASQIYVVGINSSTWTQVFGGDQLKNINDRTLRRHLANFMTLNFDQIDTPAIDTPYRHHVRAVIPEDIQDAIRAQCGDTAVSGKPFVQALPATCRIDLPAARWADAAARLRRVPTLVDELRWHRAASAAFLSNMTLFESEANAVLQRMDAK